MASTDDVTVVRVHETPVKGDDAVLVDRIRPHGLRQAKANLDEWSKAVPSTVLRKWSNNDPKRFHEFGHRYQSELEEPGGAEVLQRLRDLAQPHNLTPCTAAKHADISAGRPALEVTDVTDPSKASVPA